ncbi:hypothetical protein [Pseudophaeobacter sp. TrK17]|uniref:hypothetical protein n=1 Tax=Pseudophaeobacter sp. TrK17 TaxID=2815167 RepID=UPI0035D0E8B2
MNVSEIVNRESFAAWLEELPEERRYEWAVTLATRTALRVFPICFAKTEMGTAQERELTFLSSLRSLLISGVTGRMQTPDLKKAVAKAVDHDATGATAVAMYTAYAANPDAVYGYATSIAQTANAAEVAFNVTYAAAERGPNPAAQRAAFAASKMWRFLRHDIQMLDRADALLHLPLWPEETPIEIERAWNTGRSWMQTAPGHAFWIRWYDAILAGRPLTQDWDSHWQLMHDIALIPDEAWGEGKEQDAIRVAGIIDLITQKHALRQEVAGAKRALENETFNAMTLGRHRDNLPDDMPPSQIVEYRARLRELETALDEVDAALVPPIPDVEVLEEATGRLWAIWEKIKKYPVALAFVTLIGAAATGAAGQAGVRGMDWFFDQGMPQLIRGSKDIAPKLSTPHEAPKGWEKPSVDI